MKNKIIITSVAVFFLTIVGIQAQENVGTAGGDATGSNGTSSYTVGQVVYTTTTGTNGSVSQGVQQTYEITTTVGVSETSINLEMNVYPNPVTNYLTLTVGDTDDMDYQLSDMNGKVLESNKVNANSTTIKMEELSTATYFLKVMSNNQVIKIFKIIKSE